MPLADDFKSMWVPCRDPDVHFSSYGMGDGALYRWSVVIDHVLSGLGVTLAFNGALLLIFPTDAKDGRFSFFTNFLCVLQFVLFVTLVWLDVSLHFFDLSSLRLEEMNKSFVHMDRFYVGTSALFVCACLGSQCRINPLVRGYSMLHSDRWTFNVVQYQVSLTLLRTATLASIISYPLCNVWYLIRSLAGTDAPHATNQFDEIVLFGAQCLQIKFLLFLQRFLAIRNLHLVTSAEVHMLNILTIVSLSSTQILGVFGRQWKMSDDHGTNAVIHSATEWVQELVFLAALSFTYIRNTSDRFKDLSKKTLEEILMLQRATLSHAWLVVGHVFCNYWSGILTLVACSVQGITGPVWNQVLTWMSWDDFSQMKVSNELVDLGIRLAFLAVGGGVSLVWCSSLVPVNVFDAHRYFLSRGYLLLSFGVVLMISLSFWPKCQTCELPVACLLYTECLKRGSVILDGLDACMPSFRFSERGMAEMYSTTYINISDLACDRSDVFCPSPSWPRFPGGGEL